MRFTRQKSARKTPISSLKNAGFTLVELLIVVIILAILAAILVPQFSGSTDDAKLSALDGNLSAMRSAIALYRQQHGALPGNTTSVSGTCDGTSGTATAALADAPVGFLEQLSLYTKVNGEACSKATDAGGTKIYDYGPYFGKAALPNNPFTGVNTLEVVENGDLNMVGTGTTGGWKYDRLTGKFIANDTTAGRDLR